MKRYTLAVTSPEYWSEIHSALIVDSNQDGIPDRQVTCTDPKDHSPTRGTYELTEEEAAEIGAHPHVKWIELSPEDNRDSYPEPSLFIKRFDGDVKVYRSLDSNNDPPALANSNELNRTNWAVVRTTIKDNQDFWTQATNGTVPAQLGNASYSLTGKNVDIVIHDSGVLQYHPEFMDSNGRSRVRDIVLDGPYHIDPDYFEANGHTYTKFDGRTGITTASAINWWRFTGSRSAGFSTAPTINSTSFPSYTEARSVGNSLDGSNALTSGHGTGCAALAGGKNFGTATESLIWNMPGISDAVGLSIVTNYELMKIWHQYKPVNPETGVKNPTIVNGSWGYQAAFRSTDTGIGFTFKGNSGTINATASTTDEVTAWKNGFNNQVLGAYKSWSSSARSSSTDLAADEMMDAGVIYVAAAGNNNQYLGIGLTSPHLGDCMEDLYFGVGDSRFGTGDLVPTSHRNWMNPQGIGYDEVEDFHPVICVGAMDDYIGRNGAYAESKASYSNNGPGIDVWAPADETLSAGANGVSGDQDFQRQDDTRFYDKYFNGTSAAAPVVTGVIALYLQTNPTATSKEVKNWLNRYGSVVEPDNAKWFDWRQDPTQFNYWTEMFNLRGAPRRILYNPYANDVVPKIENLTLDSVSIEIK